jgi:hypothetical protein
MNPFVDPNKRDVSLPSGCKDLIDVLTHSGSKQNEAIQRFLQLVLLQAQRDKAIELIIGSASAGENVPLKYKVDDTWYDLAPFPSSIRPAMIAELARMAKLSDEQSPRGLFDVTIGMVRMKWIIALANNDAECRLIRIG